MQHQQGECGHHVALGMGSHSGLCPALCNPGCGVGQCYTRCCSCPPLFSPGWGLCGAPSTALPVSGPPRGSADGGWAALQEGLDGHMDTWMRGSRAARRGSQPEHGAGATGPRHCRCTAPHLRGGTRPSPAVASAAPGDGRGTQFGKNGKKWQRPSSSEQNTHFRQRDSRLPAAPRAAPRLSRSA